MTGRAWWLLMLAVLAGWKNCCCKGECDEPPSVSTEPPCPSPPAQEPGTATIFRDPCYQGSSIRVTSSANLPAGWGGRLGSIAIGENTRGYVCPASGPCATTDDSRKVATDGIARVRVEPMLWGVADLHTHLATHLGFGAMPGGAEGIFWGKPGMSLDAADVEADLPPCANDKHSGIDGDLVRHRTRISTIQALDAVGGAPHAPAGFPSFASWPNARSIMHQQMHVTWLHRAYQGGLRLVVSAAVDNQTLDVLWHRHHGRPAPVVDPTFDLDSARRQLTFIRNFAAANASWMEIAESPADARRIVGADRLAIVLAVEMDKLTPPQILELREQHGVRLVTPIHLADNVFGGAAVYEDAFNTNNHFLNGSFFRTDPDPDIAYRPKEQTRLEYVGCCWAEWGAMVEVTEEVSECTGCPGVRNRLGLRSPQAIETLMRAGLMIDVAHMSDNAMEEAIALAEQHGYPLLNTHTSLALGNRRDSERAMKTELALRMERLGGMLGLGTAGGETSPIESWVEAYFNASATMKQRVALGTDLNGFAVQIWRSEVTIAYPFDVAPGLDFRTDAAPTRSLDRLEVGDKVYDIGMDGLAHVGLLPDFLEAVRVKSVEWSVALAPLYRSAHELIDMWERTIAAADAM